MRDSPVNCLSEFHLRRTFRQLVHHRQRLQDLSRLLQQCQVRRTGSALKNIEPFGNLHRQIHIISYIFLGQAPHVSNTGFLECTIFSTASTAYQPPKPTGYRARGFRSLIGNKSLLIIAFRPGFQPCASFVGEFPHALRMDARRVRTRSSSVAVRNAPSSI
jgi:hypothetical protein